MLAVNSLALMSKSSAEWLDVHQKYPPFFKQKKKEKNSTVTKIKMK